MNITFTEEKRNEPHWSGWYSAMIDYIDTYFTIDGVTRHLRGIAECAPSYEKREIEDLKQQLIDNEAKYIRFYCHAPIEDCHPLSFLSWVRESKLSFEPFSVFKWIKALKCWEFRGNLREYSSVYDYRIWDRSLAIKVKREFLKLNS